MNFSFIAATLLLTAGILLPCADARVNTFNTVEQAKERSAKFKKDYLVFNHADWDLLSSSMFKTHWKNTKYLDKTLEPNTILTDAIFENDLADTNTKRNQEKKNKGLGKTPPSIPSVFFFDSDGFLYATLSGSEIPGEESQFADKVAEIQKKRIKREELIKEAMFKKGVERAKILGSAADIQGIKTSPKILELIRAADPSDESGYIKRLTFDIFSLHKLLKEPEEKALQELDKKIADEGYSVEQRQMMLGLKNGIYRRNPEKNEKKIAETYEKMYKLDPTTIMGRSGMKGFQDTLDINKMSYDLYNLPIPDALKKIDAMLADTSFPYSVDQKQDLLEVRARCMLAKSLDYKDEIVETYKKLIDLAPDSKMAKFAQQEIDFLTLSEEELKKRERRDRDDFDRPQAMGEEIYPDDDED